MDKGTLKYNLYTIHKNEQPKTRRKITTNNRKFARLNEDCRKLTWLMGLYTRFELELRRISRFVLLYARFACIRIFEYHFRFFLYCESKRYATQSIFL